MSPKKFGKTVLCRLLEAQVKRLRRRHDFKIVAVAGSVGKTSTKLAIAKTLAGNQRVLYQDGNYNDRLTVPLVLFGHGEPGIYNIFAWIKILINNESKLRRPYPYDVASVEIGTDGPGQLRKFAYLKPEISVITAVAAEHMEFFGSLDSVAREELEPSAFSATSLLNIDDIPGKYLPAKETYAGYGTGDNTDYALIKQQSEGLTGQRIICKLPDGQQLELSIQLLGAQGAKTALAALAVAHLLGLSPEAAAKSLAKLTPASGRMQVLSGQKDSTVIDDTYNASPLAMLAALDVLQSAAAKQRIAILGSMKELGQDSQADHKSIGKACDPRKLDLVVTIGQEASEWLAPAAARKGCQVKSFQSPYEAGEYVLRQLKPSTVVLAKGSQNGVFAEEALKPLLADPDDASKLVRQSSYWLGRKQSQFGKH